LLLAGFKVKSVSLSTALRNRYFKPLSLIAAVSPVANRQSPFAVVLARQEHHPPDLFTFGRAGAQPSKDWQNWRAHLLMRRKFSAVQKHRPPKLFATRYSPFAAVFGSAGASPSHFIPSSVPRPTPLVPF
jgi:hypothetical protein